MKLKIFLTADVHLGMKFAGYTDVGPELSEARFQTFSSLVEKANGEGCDLFVVAGDLFDRVSVTSETVVRAAGALREFAGDLSVVVPGNHDYLAPGSARLWNEFREKCPDNALFLGSAEACPLHRHGLDAVLYPAPCGSKHSEGNAIGWIRALDKTGTGAARVPDESGETLRIGIAHGSLKGLAPDLEERYFPMAREELLACGLDLWLLGHIHTRYPARPDTSDRIYYPGTPEPDGFDCDHGGTAWVLAVEGDRSVRALPLATGKHRFLRLACELGGAGDIEALKGRLSAPEAARTLYKLSLTGRLPRELFRRIPSLEGEISRSVFYLQSPLDTEGLREEITREDIGREFSERSFPHGLLTALAESGDHEALQIAYEMIMEAKKG